MKKTTEKYKNSLLKPIHKGLQNGMSVKQLAKKFSISEKMVSEIDYMYREIEDKENKICHKKYTAYKAHIEKKKGTPYDSKLGGIPYISDGDKWITCAKCKIEKVLILQLNINELPDVSSALREWDFVQVFACMKPSEVLIESNRCYNIIERNPHYYCSFDEEVDGKNMNPKDPFNLYFDIRLIKKDKRAKSFVYPPWIDGYNLFLNTKDKKVESTIYNDQRSYVWAEQHCFEEKIITKWEKLQDVECEEHFKNLNICSVYENSDSDLLGLLNSYWIEEQSLGHMAFIKLSELQKELSTKSLTKKEMEEWIEKEKKVQQIMNCPCCDKPLTLLFQFSLSGKNELILKSERNSWRNDIYALFYCEDEPEVMSCQWVGNED